jgi:hypothetical protein
MPKASVSLETEKKDLKTAPPDGYVVLRRMSYGQSVERRSMLTMGFEAADGNKSDLRGEMAIGNKRITLFEFSHCVVEHNLFVDEEETILFDFTKGDPTVLDKLDPKVGQEIEKYIADMNNFSEEDQGN